MSKGWFSTPGRAGDRTLEQQLVGLDELLGSVRGRSVLDVGCAEGLIGMRLRAAGAARVHGVESVAEHIAVARRLAGGDAAVTFEQVDANDWTPSEQFDVVLLLAILHKLRDPTAAALRFAAAVKEELVVRLPPAGAVISDARSGFVAHDVGAAFAESGLELEHTCFGTFGEWIGYYRRRKAPAAATAAAQPGEKHVDPTPSVDKPSDMVEHPEVDGQGPGVDQGQKPTGAPLPQGGGGGQELFPESKPSGPAPTDNPERSGG